MKKILTTILLFAVLVSNAATILWAALDESSTINGIAFRSYSDPQNNFVNAARLSVSDSSTYSMDSVTQLALWIPEWEGEPGYWEEDFPVNCLHDEDGDYYMSEWSSQFNLGDNPDTTKTVFFELGYVNWDDFDSPFITLATANATVQDLIDGNYTYQSGSIAPPDERNWMPTQFNAVPEPSATLLALFGIGMFLKRRK